MTLASNESETRPSPSSAPRFVLLKEEARGRGFRNVLAFRRWCRRHGVPIRADGRLQWVCVADVDAAVIALSPQGPPPLGAGTADVDPVAAGVADLMMGARARR